VIAAAAALMSDLEVLGVLDDEAEDLGRGEDDARLVCSTCQMRRLGYGGLADRLEFAVGVSGQISSATPAASTVPSASSRNRQTLCRFRPRWPWRRKVTT
jgi:hypothetical protein